jgi:hypothetical protein
VRVDSFVAGSGSGRRALADSTVVVIEGVFLPDGSGTIDALVNNIQVQHLGI